MGPRSSSRRFVVGFGYGSRCRISAAGIGDGYRGLDRNPAGNCGVVGLKPTYGLVSRRGVFPVAFTLDHVGPMARSVADVALFLDGLVGSNTEGRFGADLERGV